MDKSFSFKEVFKRLKKMQNIEYFIFILAIAIIVGLFSNWFQPRHETNAPVNSQNQAPVNDVLSSEDDSDDQETRLKEVLSTIKGAGKVDVMITYKTGKELVPAMNTTESSTETEEQDSNGGVRRVSQTDINTQPVSMTTASGSQPLITREIQPEVLGVIVVAEGADDIRVRMELQKAVQTVLGVSSSQVEIFVMEDN